MEKINWKNHFPCTTSVLGIASVLLLILFLRFFEEVLFFSSLVTSVLGTVVGIIALIKADEKKKKLLAGAGLALSILTILGLVWMMFSMFSRG